MEEILARMGELRDELETLAAVEGDFDADQEARWAELNTEFDALNATKATLEARAAKIDAVRQAATNPAARMSGSDDFNKGVNVRKSVDDPYSKASGAELRYAASMSEDEHEQVVGEYRDAARRAIESSKFVKDSHQESAMNLVDSADVDGTLALHMLRTGSPTYLKAYRKYLRTGNLDTLSLEERTAMSLTAGNGGYLMPFTLDPSVIDVNSGTTSPMRQISTVKTITTNIWHGVASSGVSAEWTGEATEAADASPSFTQPTVQIWKGDVYIQASMEVVADTMVADEIAGMIAAARDRLEASAFVTGSGSTQPTGVVTGVSAVTASRIAGTSGAAGAADFVVADVYKLSSQLPPYARGNASWLAEQTTYNAIRQFATGSGPQHAFWADLGLDRPPLLLGRPAYEASSMDNTYVSGSNDDILIVGDFRHGYVIVDRIGTSIAYNPLVLGSNRRPSGEVGWYATFRTGGNVVDANAFRLLRI